MKLAMKATFEGLVRTLKWQVQSIRENNMVERHASPYANLPVRRELTPKMQPRSEAENRGT